ncbi:MAG TPA: hypothetical protein VIG40_00875, partial [Tissierellaceae bacterium]
PAMGAMIVGQRSVRSGRPVARACRRRRRSGGGAVSRVARLMLGASALTTLGALPPFLLGAQAVLVMRDLDFGADKRCSYRRC